MAVLSMQSQGVPSHVSNGVLFFMRANGLPVKAVLRALLFNRSEVNRAGIPGGSHS